MSVKDDGDPAFPVGFDSYSTRDYFAAMADVRAYGPADAYAKSHGGRESTIGELARYIAEIRYAEADAMLAARTGEKE